MPHLRRQPNPHDFSGSQGANVPGSLRAQFQTPPSRQTPSNPTHRLPPSTGPNDITPEPMAATAHPAAQSHLFSIFGRSRLEQQQQQQQQRPAPAPVEAEDVFDDDYEPNARDFVQGEEEDSFVPEDQFSAEEGIEDEEIDDEEIEEVIEDQLEDQLEDPDEEMHDRGTRATTYTRNAQPQLTNKADKSPSPLPPNLREISSLASWTVSTSKPGCGVAALRHPSPSQYWQSDGPQPHTLTLHFFKLVAVVRIRVYLDFDLDESYTPTKMVFLAGMGGNDLVEFATWEGDGPCGWVDVPLEGVGGRNGGWVRDEGVRRKRRSKSGAARRRTASGQRAPGIEHDSEDGSSDEDEDDGLNGSFGDDHDDPYAGNVLKAMVIQMRVIENHQNGKDTHVRGFQVFACDDNRRRMAAAPSASADGRHRRHSVRHSFLGGAHDPFHPGCLGSEEADANRLVATSGLDEPDWMGEPVIR